MDIQCMKREFMYACTDYDLLIMYKCVKFCEINIHSFNQCLLIIREVQWQSPGPRFNIKMTSYRYRKSHCGDKTVVRSSYLHNGISYNGKMTSLYWIRALRAISQDKPQPSITKITLKTICLNFHSNLPWISEFIWWASWYGTQCVPKYSFSSRYSTFFAKYPN